MAGRAEAEAFLAGHPEMAFFELIFTGMSGVARGKRLRRHELLPIYDTGRFLPVSILVADVRGEKGFGLGAPRHRDQWLAQCGVGAIDCGIGSLPTVFTCRARRPRTSRSIQSGEHPPYRTYQRVRLLLRDHQRRR